MPIAKIKPGTAYPIETKLFISSEDLLVSVLALKFKIRATTEVTEPAINANNNVLNDDEIKSLLKVLSIAVAQFINSVTGIMKPRNIGIKQKNVAR